MTDQLDIDGIERDAKAAGGGSWITADHVGEPRAIVAESTPGTSLLGIDVDGMAIVSSEADARHIVRMDPRTTLALAELARLSPVAGETVLADYSSAAVRRLIHERDALRATKAEWLPEGEVPVGRGLYLRLEGGEYHAHEFEEECPSDPESACWRYLSKSRWLPLPAPPTPKSGPAEAAR